MKRVKDWLIAAGVLALAKTAPRPEEQEERIVERGEPSPGAELVVLALLGLSTLCAGGFVAVYVLDRIPSQTQFLGLSLGLALLFGAAALILVGKRLVVAEELEEDYPPREHAPEQDAVVEIVEESGSRFTRKRLVTMAGAGAAGALGLAALTPALSLGPAASTGPFFETPWRRGRRLVDEDGRPYGADEIEEETFYTAYPEGADREQLAAPLVLVRLPESELALPPERAGWAPGGIVAYSKICTHAGCAVALYRTPKFRPAEAKPALVCPCHYSTFDPASGGTVLFGPAGRPLPQLPLEVDASRHLRAAGTFDEAVGPSWWGVRMGKPHT